MELEVHLTYRCNLRCDYCNRGVSIAKPHTPDLTMEQWERCLMSAPDVLRTKSHGLKVTWTGGEPTLCDVLKFAHRTFELAPHVKQGIETNEASPRAKQALAEMQAAFFVQNRGSVKVDGQPTYEFDKSLFCSPADIGVVPTKCCNWGNHCGISVDAGGMTPCVIGGTIDAILGLGLRTWDWNELTDARLLALCAHCGRSTPWDGHEDQIVMFRGHRMTAEWKAALERCA